MTSSWNETVASHRDDVRSRILSATVHLVAAHGVASVTMTQVAAGAGIGRATLYRHFPGVDEILTAWHRDRIAGHMRQLAHTAAVTTEPRARLAAVLGELCSVLAGRTHHGAAHGAELAAHLHGGEEVAEATRALERFLVTEVLEPAVVAGTVRADVPAADLARFCRHALAAATGRPTTDDHLVQLVLDGIRPPGP